MTFKEIAKLLETNIQTIPNLVNVLKRGFEEAEAGSDVEVTQVVSSGTKIATIAVGEESTDIYAPENEVAYTTTERKIGTWTDGSDLYEITVKSPGTITTTPREVLDMTSNNVKEVIAIMPVYYEDNAYASFWNLAAVKYTDSTKKVTVYTNQYSIDGGVIATIRYTKNTEE